MATDPWTEIATLLERYDGDAKFEVGSLSAWSGEIRLTLSDPLNAPARSIAFYSVGNADPWDAATAVLADLKEWLETSGVEPMPVPEWMKEG